MPILYTHSHEWIARVAKQVTIGITDYGQESLGEIMFVELPSVGQEITRGQMLCVVESVKAASEISSPVSGVVKEINSLLTDTPQLINTSPEDKGWICVLGVNDFEPDGQFLHDTQYRKLTGRPA